MRVRKVVRAAADGYSSGLVMGIHASADAELLALELALASARIERIKQDPQGLFGEVRDLARDGQIEEALWLTFLVAAVGVLESDDPFAEIERARVPWATGAAIDAAEIQTGPRGVTSGAQLPTTINAYRAWAHRGTTQQAALSGDRSWAPQRRFDRAFERLALPGFGRAARFEFVVLTGALRLIDAEPWSLQVASEPRDTAVLAAKRIFGIGDPLLLERRAGDLAKACNLAPAALDLALVNWSRRTDDPAAQRWSGGVPAPADEELLALIRAELGLYDAEAEDEPSEDEPA